MSDVVESVGVAPISLEEQNDASRTRFYDEVVLSNALCWHVVMSLALVF